MKVMLWHWGRRGGGPHYTLELARELRRLDGFEIHLSLSRQSELFAQSAALGLPAFHVDTYHDKLSAALAMARVLGIRRDFRRYIAENYIEVVVCTMSHLWNAAVAGTIRSAGAKYLLTLHDAVPHPGDNYLVRQWLLRNEIEKTDGILALSEHVRNQLCQVYGYPQDRSWVAPLGVFQAGVGGTPRRFPGHTTAFRLLFFGRILPYKGLGLLLEAFRTLRARYPGLELSIIGPGDAGPYLSVIRETPGIFLDNRWVPDEEMADILTATNLVVLPYVEASQSGLAPTALGAGVPVVTTPVGGLKEQVRHLETGVVAEAVNAEAVADAIERIIQDPALYEACSRNAIWFVQEKLSWPTIARKVADVIAQVRSD